MFAVVLGLAGSCIDPQGSPYFRQWSVLGCLCLVLVVGFFSGPCSSGIFSCLQSVIPGVGQVLGTGRQQ